MEKTNSEAFSDNHACFSLILHQHLTSNIFLKFGCIVESETESVNFCTLPHQNSSIFHFEWILLPRINFNPSHLENIKIFWTLYIFQMLTHFTIKKSTTHLTQKVFTYCEALKIIGVYTCFLVFLFWKLEFYHCQKRLSIVLLEMTAYLAHFWEKVCEISRNE